MSAKTILIITDNYPPNITGGAEISLHNILQGMPRHDNHIVIAALTDGLERLRKETYEDRTVYRIPFNNDWPINFSNAGRSKKLFRVSKFLLYQIFRRNFRSSYRLSLAIIIKLRHPNQTGILPLIDVDYLLNSPVSRFIEEVISDIDPDIIHADNYRSIVLANNLSKKVPVLSYVRDNRFFCAQNNQAMNVNGKICTHCDKSCVDNRIPRFLTNRVKGLMEESLRVRRDALEASSSIVVTSKFLKNQIQDVVADDRRILHIPNITEPISTLEEIQDKVKVSSIPEILCIGAINLNKGQNILISLLSALSSELSEFRIVIAGRGEMTDSLVKQASDAGMLDRLHIAGFLSRKEMYRAYARCSIVVCPAVWPEPFGRVPIEAAMSSKPVVAFAVGGLAENIINNHTGVLVDPMDTDGLCREIIKLIQNKDYAERLGRQAKQHVEELFKSQRSAEKLEHAWAILTDHE